MEIDAYEELQMRTNVLEIVYMLPGECQKRICTTAKAVYKR